MRDQAYLRDAEDLARILGAAHAIRISCNGTDDQYWRRYMLDMLALEAPERGGLRSALAGAFNDGYAGAMRRFPACDNRAVAAEADYARQGETLALRLASENFPKDTSPDRSP